jgi:undecaprenyl pyrophosphate phosphatase UppP
MLFLLIFAYLLLLVAIIGHNTRRISANLRQAHDFGDQRALQLGAIIACLIYIPAATIIGLGLLFLKQHVTSGYMVCAMWLIAGLWILLGYLLTESKAGNEPWHNA